jgi:hypothetical protein
MDEAYSTLFSEPVTVFRDRRLPTQARPVGYAALIEAYKLRVPLPHTLSAIGTRHRRISSGGWRILTPRHAPDASLEGHLTFALKWEGVDLAVLKQLFMHLPAERMIEFVSHHPTGRYSRRIWFLYEWLTSRRLALPDIRRGNYVDAVDTSLQLAVNGRRSPRHRVNDNLPGTPELCVLVHRTEKIEAFLGLNLAERAKEVVDRVPADILARAAAFLLLEDSRSSHTIEGEQPPQRRIERWGSAVGQAGRLPLTLEELLRLQRVVIGDARFVRLGLRAQGGFVGEHDRETGMPLPSHVSARHDDLPSLISGLLAFNERSKDGLDPVVAAAALAFAFVNIHPFVDGNGRIHRYLIHHALAERGFTPPGVVFPISSAILRDIDSYGRVLRQHTSRLLEHIEWEPTEDGNIKVLNDTGDLYRYYDATPHAEFLFQCVRSTVEQDLPRETAFLQAYDRFSDRVQLIVDLPGSTRNLLFRFLHQNAGRLSRRARTREFKAFSDDEVEEIEAIYAEELAGLPIPP